MDVFLQELPPLQAPPLIEPRFLEQYPRLLRHEKPPVIFTLLADSLSWRLAYALVRSDFRLPELARRVDATPSRVAARLRRLRTLGLVEAHRSAANARETYYRVDQHKLREVLMEAGGLLHPGLSSPQVADTRDLRDLHKQPVLVSRFTRQPLRVLFVCTQNSARSQMAEGISRFAGGVRVAVCSAGTRPSEVNPYAMRVLSERQIDISRHWAKHVDGLRTHVFDYVITVCDRAREECRDIGFAFPGSPEYRHWSLPDPASVPVAGGARYRAFNRTADRIASRVHYFLLEHTSAGRAA